MSKLTKRFVETLKPDPLKTLLYWDTDLKGFGLVLLPSGRRTYCVQYRNQDRILKRTKIGVHGPMTTEEARGRVKTLLGNIARGEDPLKEKQDFQKMPTMRELAEDYLKRHAVHKRPKSVVEDRFMIDHLILPPLGSQKVASVTKREIESLHLHLKSTPYRANRMLALLSKMMNLAVSWGWRTDNPVLGIHRYPEQKRDRWLNEEELKRFWEVLDRYPHQVTAYVLKFLLLTGARKGEALNATWDQLDLKAGVWEKPAHLTKQKKKEYLPLSQRTLALLEEVKSLHPESPFVFPGKVPGEPLRELKTFWSRVLRETEIKHLRIHDLRHTHASHLASQGLSLTIIGKLLGHTQASTTQRYAHLANQTLKEAAELFSQTLGKGK